MHAFRSIRHHFKLAALAAALALSTGAAHAQDFTPSDFTDSALRLAVTQFNNASGGPHRILLGAGTYVLTQAGADEDGNATGDLDLLAGGLLTQLEISGVSPAETIIDAGQLDRIFHAGSNVNLTLKNLTLKNGKVTSSFGGRGPLGQPAGGGELRLREQCRGGAERCLRAWPAVPRQRLDLTGLAEQ